jgi:hypothetical protein
MAIVRLKGLGQLKNPRDLPAGSIVPLTTAGNQNNTLKTISA